MTGSLLAVLILTAQPVEIEAEAELGVGAEVEAPVGEAEADAEAGTRTDRTATAASEAEEDVVCRRRLRPAERIGQRHRVVEDCRPRSEWENARRRRGADD